MKATQFTPSDNSWLSFEGGTEADLEDFLAKAPLHRPVRVILTGEEWGLRACKIVAASPAGIDLRMISLRGASIRDAGIESLLSTPVLAPAHYLGIERCGLTDRGVELLAQLPQVNSLRELSLCNRGGIETGPLNVIGDAGARSLAASPRLSQLEKLNLWNTGVGDRGLAAIVTSPYLTRLSSITAWGTRLSREGASQVKALAQEQWESRTVNTLGAALCWIHTDYDERIITYEQ